MTREEELKAYMRDSGVKIKEIGEYLNVNPKRISVALFRGLTKVQDGVIRNAVDAVAKQKIKDNQLF